MRSYVPGLVKLTRALCRYLDRHRSRIRQWLTANRPDAVAAFDALLLACEAFEVLFPDVPPPLDRP